MALTADRNTPYNDNEIVAVTDGTGTRSEARAAAGYAFWQLAYGSAGQA